MAKRGRSAKQKGSKAERLVRDQLKRIYPSDRRTRINRVPMSGAGWMKGDVIDMNDTDYSYEVKNQESLSLHKWWDQAVSQCQPYQQPVLVFTSNYRPLYWVIRLEDFNYLVKETGRDRIYKLKEITVRTVYNKLSSLEKNELAKTILSDEEVVILGTEDYIQMRKELYESNTR